MASYHLSVHPNVSRGKGQSLVATAAYNERTRLVDERTGEAWDYRHLGGLLFSGMYAPKEAPDWARDLGQLVNEVERFEKRSDAQLAMNLDIALPFEQTLEQNRRLIQDFVREQFMRPGYAAHVAIHAPDRDGDDRNIHAHVLVTLRKIGPEGFARTKSEQQERYRNRGEYVEQLRDSWEKLANRHLERNGHDARIDRRSLEDQGIEREPQQHRGPAVTAMEREGKVTGIGQEIRQRQQHHAELRTLAAEEQQIDAEIIDLEARRAQRQAREAAKGQVDDVRPDAERAARQTEPEAGRAAERSSSARPAAETARGPGMDPELAAEIARGYAAAKGRSDDIRADFIAAAAPEAVQTQEHGRGAEAPEPENTASTARESVPETPEIADIAGRAVGGIFGGLAKMVERAFDYLADLIAPPPPPTKDQAERMERAAEEQREQAAAEREAAEREARFQELLEQMKRDDAERERQSLAERFGRARDYDRDDDYDRGRERER